eukprot:CAMPEP_0177579070 /NCGR_PEP_ID=MMETSP0419_2-20121207/735_1 /TAXON_ID=582737 /ORGANISM="Tetraselmis sp., Strain GSL018" /LENGTH=275 /DNA_ID=CAMNT_0019067655 /DNA_START=550 /DNA_END=1376 /DNA_ORIENTATION=+
MLPSLDPSRSAEAVESEPAKELSSLEDLDSYAELVLQVARERSLGSGSVWYPYISSLPESLGCPWSKEDEQLELLLKQQAARGFPVDLWSGEVERAKDYASRVSQGLWRDFGQYIGLTAGDLRWALGIVASRVYGGSASPCLIPFVDLFNHDSRAAPFSREMLKVEFEDLETGEPRTSVEEYYTVWSRRDGHPKALAAGEEVYVDYALGGMSALDVFLSTASSLTPSPTEPVVPEDASPALVVARDAQRMCLAVAAVIGGAATGHHLSGGPAQPS